MSHRFKLDENMPGEAIELLRGDGHDVRTVLDELLGGSADPRILQACRDDDRMLVTLDLDFADLQLYAPSSHPGIWVLRGRSQSIETTMELLLGALSLLRSESPRHRLWIVEHGRIRIRD